MAAALPAGSTVARSMGSRVKIVPVERSNAPEAILQVLERRNPFPQGNIAVAKIIPLESEGSNGVVVLKHPGQERGVFNVTRVLQDLPLPQEGFFLPLDRAEILKTLAALRENPPQDKNAGANRVVCLLNAIINTDDGNARDDSNVERELKLLTIDAKGGKFGPGPNIILHRIQTIMNGGHPPDNGCERPQRGRPPGARGY